MMKNKRISEMKQTMIDLSQIISNFFKKYILGKIEISLAYQVLLFQKLKR